MTDPAPSPEPRKSTDLWRITWRLLKLLRPHWTTVTLGFTFLAIGACITAALPWVLKVAVDVDIKNLDFPGLIDTCLLFLGFQLLLILLRLAQQVMLEGVGQEVIGSLRERLFDHLLKMPISYHDEHPPGKLISRVESDTEQLRQMFSNAVVVILGNGLLFVVMFTVMASVDLALTAVVAVVVPLLLILVIWFHRSTAPLYLAVRKKTAVLCGKLAEWIQGASILQSLRLEKETARRLMETNVDRFDMQYAVERRVILFWNMIFVVEGLGAAAVLGLGAYRVGLGIATIGAIVMFIDYLRRVFEPIHQLAHQLQSFQQAFAGARMIFELLDSPTEPDAVPATAPPSTDGALIAFENVWFAYKEEEWVLRDVSFRLPAGEHWALIGVTGGGKSTMVSLLLRFYEPTKGRITIDGRDIREMTVDEVRARIGFVPQDLYLFPGDVMGNLRLGDVDEAQAHRATEMLGVDEFLSGLPDGYATEVAERGSNFSTGERQLVCAARALIANPPILVFDEATSAVDPQTELRIQSALSQLKTGRTTLTVAHRLSTILGADRILVLDQGQLVEQGSHHELIHAKSHYSRLFELQFGKLSQAPATAGSQRILAPRDPEGDAP